MQTNKRPLTHLSVVALATIVVTLTVTGPGQAQYQFVGGGTGFFSNATNWSGNVVPPVGGSATTTLTFTGSGSPLSVTNDRGNAGVFSLNAMTFAATAGAYNISGATLNFANNGSTTPTLVLNNSNAITLSSNITLSNNLTISGAGSATFAGNISGNGTSTGAVTGQLLRNGTGTLTLTGNGNANLLAINGIGSVTTFSGGTYTFNATDTGNNKASITVDSTGTASQLQVQSGASVTGVNVFVGRQANNNGSATVTGTNSVFAATNQLTVGSRAGSVGTMTVQSGGKAQAAVLGIGGSAGGQGTVTTTGAGSRYISTGNMIVGSAGSGTLNLQTGGSSTAANVFIGDLAGSDGTINVTAAGNDGTNSVTTLAVAGNTLIGNNGTGALNISGGGTVTSGTTAIAARTGSTGTLSVSGAGSSFAATGQLQVGGTGANSGGTGSLVVQNGATVSATDTLIIYGTGSVTVNGGTLTVGNLSNGGATVGDIDITNGMLTFGGANTSTLYQGDISGTNATLIKTGTGETTLDGTHTFTGTTQIQGGALNVRGSFSGSSMVIDAGGELGGNGTVGAVTLNADGALAAGIDDSSVLNLTSLVWNPGGDILFDLGDPGTGTTDLLRISSALTKGTGSGAYHFTFSDTGYVQGQVYDLIEFGSLAGFTANDFTYSAPAGIDGEFRVEGNSLRFGTFSNSAAAPEPSSLVLALLCGTFIPVMRRCKAQKEA